MFYVSKDQLNKLKLLEGRSSGIYGTCYKYKDNSVLKVFSNNSSYFDRKKIIKKNVCKNLHINIENIAFPTNIKVVYGHPFAYVMPIINGINFEDIALMLINENYDIPLEGLSLCYHDALLKAKKLSEYNIKIDDLNVGNCKITKDFNIGIFDTDLYYDKPTEMSKEEKDEKNISLLNENLKYFIKGFLSSNNIIFNFEYKKESFLDKALNRIMRVSQNEVNSFGTLAKYKFTDDQIIELGKVL